MMSRVFRRPAVLRAVLAMPLLLALGATPVAASPAEFHNEVSWTLACEDHGTIEVRSQLSNGVVWLTADGRTLLTISGEGEFDGVWRHLWGMKNTERTGLAERVFTCTTTIQGSSGQSIDLRLQALYVP